MAKRIEPPTDSRRYASGGYTTYPQQMAYPAYPAYPAYNTTSYGTQASTTPPPPPASASYTQARTTSYSAPRTTNYSTQSAGKSTGSYGSSSYGSSSYGSSSYGSSSYGSSSYGSSYDPSTATDDYTKATFQVEEKKVDTESEQDLFREQKSSGINFSKYGDIPVSVEGDNVPPPIATWAESKLPPALMQNIVRAKYTVPTPVQKYAIPIASTGRDLMACAQTGSGKTAGFMFPVISELLAAPRKNFSRNPSALVLAPTRELASQIQQEGLKFCFQTGLRCVVVYGGAPIGYQVRELERGCDILVGTPGRLLDMVDRGHVSFAGIKFLVLDEADRMLDMGFEKEIRKIVEQRDMPRKRQTMMFSATFAKEIRQLASDFLRSFLFLKVGRVGSTTDSITQNLRLVRQFDKQAEVLRDLNLTTGKTLVFAETKRDTDSLARFLFSKGVSATGIHGDRQQREREAALRSFKYGKIRVLVATDVAARGLDIDDVAHVINYDIPANIDSYIHRIGRTGRAGNVGIATSYFTESNKPLAKKLVKVLRESNQAVPDWLEKLGLEFHGKGGGAMRRGGGGSRGSPYGSRGGGYGGYGGYGR